MKCCGFYAAHLLEVSYIKWISNKHYGKRLWSNFLQLMILYAAVIWWSYVSVLFFISVFQVDLKVVVGKHYQLGKSDIYIYIHFFFKGEEKKKVTIQKKKKICLNAVNSYPECLRKIWLLYWNINSQFPIVFDTTEKLSFGLEELPYWNNGFWWFTLLMFWKVILVCRHLKIFIVS